MVELSKLYPITEQYDETSPPKPQKNHPREPPNEGMTYSTGMLSSHGSWPVAATKRVFMQTVLVLPVIGYQYGPLSRIVVCIIRFKTTRDKYKMQKRAYNTGIELFREIIVVCHIYDMTRTDWMTSPPPTPPSPVTRPLIH